MDKLEIFALDASRNRLTASIPYKSLNWHRCYYEPGDFVLEVPRSVYSSDWKYIYTDQRPETGEIQKVEIRDGEHGWEDTVVLSGFFEEGMLNRRCFLNQYYEPLDVRDNVAAVTSWLEQYLPSDIEVLSASFSGEEKSLNPSVSQLGDVVFSELQTIGASVRVGYDFEANKRTAQVWQGKDRTQSQSGNPWAVFSDTWGSLSGYRASVDRSSYRNKCYVLRDYSEPAFYESDGTPKLSVYVEQLEDTTIKKWYYIRFTRKTDPLPVRLDDGVAEDLECFIDKRGEEPAIASSLPTDMRESPDDFDLPRCEYQYRAFDEALKQEGLAFLINDNVIVKELDAGTVDTKGYLEDFDLGDKVDAGVDTLGLTMEARIVEVDEVYDNNGTSISLVIGDTIVKRNR